MADLESELRGNVNKFLNYSSFTAWQAIFHVSRAGQSDYVTTNVTCNIGSGNVCIPITYSSEGSIQCPSRCLC